MFHFSLRSNPDVRCRRTFVRLAKHLQKGSLNKNLIRLIATIDEHSSSGPEAKQPRSMLSALTSLQKQRHSHIPAVAVRHAERVCFGGTDAQCNEAMPDLGLFVRLGHIRSRACVRLGSEYLCSRTNSCRARGPIMH